MKKKHKCIRREKCCEAVIDSHVVRGAYIQSLLQAVPKEDGKCDLVHSQTRKESYFAWQRGVNPFAVESKPGRSFFHQVP